MREHMIDQEKIVPENDNETLAVILTRLNASMKKNEWRCKAKCRWLEASFSWRGRKSLMGRFGGGWQWQFGFEAGSWHDWKWTIIASLLVCSIRFEFDLKGRK